MASSGSLWNRWSPLLLSLLRAVAGFLFMQHGMEKLFGFPGGGQTVHLLSLYGLAGILECFGGGLVLLGLFTRPIAFILSGEMAFAYFMAHFPANHVWPILNHGNEAVLFCFVFLYLSAAGGGSVSLDRAFRRV
ncbi:MAG TPA: DoxX family protein [Rhodanobacteraceae bacterium]|nr:DoxX family protein [Rhodanobacteraceae bacterium]